MARLTIPLARNLICRLVEVVVEQHSENFDDECEVCLLLKEIVEVSNLELENETRC